MYRAPMLRPLSVMYLMTPYRAHLLSHFSRRLILGSRALINSLLMLGAALIVTMSASRNAVASPPLNRVDLAATYTSVSIGDWQQATLGYQRQWSSRWSAGLITQYQRRGYNEVRLSDLSVGLPVRYQATTRFALSARADVTPIAQISPRYAGELTPSYRFKDAPLTLSVRYRYARYSIADTHLAQPGIAYDASPLLIQLYAFLVFPTFGPNMLTPQLRLTYALSYRWRLGWWSTYGYEVLNERFFDPARQAPKWENTLRVSYLFNDHQGINLGVGYNRFITADPRLAAEVFNQDRVELSSHYFIKF